MYKVFIKDSSITLTDKPLKNAIGFIDSQQLEDLYLELEKSAETTHKIITHSELKLLWNTWCKLFSLIEAAGGVVFNETGEILMIHRLGKWDLPKGKLEIGEDAETGAIREVVEECSIPTPKIVKVLTNSYHTYRLKGVQVLKRTYWYEMNVDGSPNPKPQQEEDITEAVWCSAESVQHNLGNSYPNIVNLLQEYTRS